MNAALHCAPLLCAVEYIIVAVLYYKCPILLLLLLPPTREIFSIIGGGENAFLFVGGTSHLKTEQISPFATRLFIMNIQEEDEGLYICAVGPLRRPFNIVVDGKENGGQSCHQNYTNEIVHSSAM